MKNPIDDAIIQIIIKHDKLQTGTNEDGNVKNTIIPKTTPQDNKIILYCIIAQINKYTVAITV